MSNIHYAIATTGNKEDDRRIKALQKKGVKVIEIVRRGIESISAQIAVKEAAEKITK